MTKYPIQGAAIPKLEIGFRATRQVSLGAPAQIALCSPHYICIYSINHPALWHVVVCEKIEVSRVQCDFELNFRNTSIIDTKSRGITRRVSHGQFCRALNLVNSINWNPRYFPCYVTAHVALCHCASLGIAFPSWA